MMRRLEAESLVVERHSVFCNAAADLAQGSHRYGTAEAGQIDFQLEGSRAIERWPRTVGRLVHNELVWTKKVTGFQIWSARIFQHPNVSKSNFCHRKGGSSVFLFFV